LKANKPEQKSVLFNLLAPQHLGLRNRAMLLAGFGGALRRSEIVGLDVGDLEFVKARGVVLTIRRFKTDQHGAGQAVAAEAQSCAGSHRRPPRPAGSEL
jgi:site-specific recombinase XerC